MNDSRIEALENNIKMQKKKNRNLGLVILGLVVIIIGILLWIYIDKTSGIACVSEEEMSQKIADLKEQQEAEEAERKRQEELDKIIKVDDETEKELRDLIPSRVDCDTYLDLQYSNTLFNVETYNTLSTTSDVKTCTFAKHVYYLKDNIDSTDQFVYITDYVLLNNPNALEGQKSYGKTYDNMEYTTLDVLGGTTEISEDIFKSLGQKYKYTFEKVEDTFKYVSTEKVE